jgi:CBS domain-containing protein
MSADQPDPQGLGPESAPPLIAIATREVAALDGASGIGRAAEVMTERGISSILVEDGEGRPAGIVTERDVLASMGAGLPAETPLSQIMSSPVFGLPGSTPYPEAYRLCLQLGLRHLAVLDSEGRTAGIVTETDFRLRLALAVPARGRPVASLMSWSPLALAAETLLSEGLGQLRACRGDAMVVVAQDRPIGILTERDLVRIYARGLAALGSPLGELMSTPVHCIRLDAPLGEAAELMRRERLRHLVAVDRQGRLAGILNGHEVAKALAGGLSDTHQEADRELLFRTVFDQAADGIALTDPETLGFVEVNEAAPSSWACASPTFRPSSTRPRCAGAPTRSWPPAGPASRPGTAPRAASSWRWRSASAPSTWRAEGSWWASGTTCPSARTWSGACGRGRSGCAP